MLELDGTELTLRQIEDVANRSLEVTLASAARDRVERAREVVEKIIASEAPVYGVNTGFGRLADVRVPSTELRQLQLNLVRSHACGLGPEFSEPEVRAMLLLRANVLARGYSGARPIVVETLLDLLRHGVHPVVPEKGSVGASGDLAPLAHIALVLIGEGHARLRGDLLRGDDALRRAGLTPLRLEAKEGLALLNGTQGMAAVGGLALRRANRIAFVADVAGAMTLEALRDTPVAFDERIHEIRPHPGQVAVAAHMRDLLQASEIRASHLDNDSRVQDAYSLRCIPQVHGAVRDALVHACEVVERESGSVTDNPIVFAETGEVLSGGNFHGAPLALVLDYAAIGLTDLASISERRTERLVNPDLSEGLPAFLTSEPGTSSGFMIAQITAVALLNEMKVLAHPASIDNVPTSGGKEDHVSMGMTSARKLREIVENAEYVLAIELLAAAEGLEHRAPLTPGRGVKKAYDIVRSHVPRLTQDRTLGPDIERIAAAIKKGEFES
jgi:histidine ammonia-lyase